MNTTELTKTGISLLIILGAIASLFFPVDASAAHTLQLLASAIVGYYFGGGQFTLPSGRKI